jgi:hypothetical protein
MTVTWVGERIANFTSYNVSVGSYNGSTLSVNSDWENSANTIAIYAGNNMPLSGVTDNAFHAVVGSLSSGGGASTSVLYADGLSTSATNAGNLGMNTTLCWMGDPNGVSLADAYLTEGGVWGGAFSPSDAVTNIANARTYGGF